MFLAQFLVELFVYLCSLRNSSFMAIELMCVLRSQPGKILNKRTFMYLIEVWQATERYLRVNTTAH